MNKKTKKNLIIDAANEKIVFKIIDNNKIYTNDYENSRKNFDKFAILLFKFLDKKMISFDIVDKVLINLGPGKYSSIRTSISTFKALNLISNHETFPQIFLDNKFFGGYDDLSNQFKIDSLNSFR